jgi:hypothetical protein
VKRSELRKSLDSVLFDSQDGWNVSSNRYTNSGLPNALDPMDQESTTLVMMALQIGTAGNAFAGISR